MTVTEASKIAYHYPDRQILENKEDDYQLAWEIFKQKISKEGLVWVITEDLSQKNIKELYEEKLQNPTFYKGLFKMFGVPGYIDGSKKEFLMTRNDIPVGQIKLAIGKIIEKKPEDFNLRFCGKILNDSDDFLSRCGWHGLGCEVFEIYWTIPLKI